MTCTQARLFGLIAVEPPEAVEGSNLVALGERWVIKYGFDEVKVQGVEYYLVREDSISLILE